MYHYEFLKFSLYWVIISLIGFLGSFIQTDPSAKLFLILLTPSVLIFGLVTALLQTYKIDSNGISIVYAYKSKILKCVRFISWENVRYIYCNNSRRVIVVAKNKENDLPDFRNIMIISDNVINWRDLIREIMQNSKNAQIEEAVKLIVAEK